MEISVVTARHGLVVWQEWI